MTFISRFILISLLAFSGCKKDENTQPTEPPKTDNTGEKPAEPGATKPTPAAKTAVTLQLNWTPEPEFGGFYTGVHKDIYAKANLDVTIKAGAAGVQTWKMVATGKVPFAIASGDEIVRARVNDADLVALFAVYQTNPHALMVHKSAGVKSLEEIFKSGKISKVAMESGLPYVHFIEKKYGFKDVGVIQHSGNLSIFLQEPKIAQQCFVFSEPVSAKEQGVEVDVFSVAEAGYNPYVAVVITSEAYLEKNRPVVERFVRATRDAWRVYLDDPGPTNEYMKEQKSPMSVKAMKMAAELQLPYIETDETRENYLGYMTQERWEELAGQLLELGEIKEKPDASKLFLNVAAN